MHITNKYKEDLPVSMNCLHPAFLGPQIKTLFTEKLKNKIASVFQMPVLEHRPFLLPPLNEHFLTALALRHSEFSNVGTMFSNPKSFFSFGLGLILASTHSASWSWESGTSNMPETWLSKSSSANISFCFLITFWGFFLVTEDESDRLCFNLKRCAAPGSVPVPPRGRELGRGRTVSPVAPAGDGFLHTRAPGVTLHSPSAFLAVRPFPLGAATLWPRRAAPVT